MADDLIDEVVIDDSGDTRKMGCLPMPNAGRPRLSWPTFGEAISTPSLIDPADWFEIDFSHLASPIKDQDGKSACFPAGTLIRMADGSSRPIEDVKTRDEVLTAEGNVGRVVATKVTREADALYRVHMKGHRHLRATAEHPVMTRRGYVPVTELVRGDYVALPRYAPRTAGVLVTAGHLEGRVYSTRSTRTRKFQIPGKRAVVVTRHVVPEVIDLTPRFGRLVGLFLAEGHTGKNKVEWTFGEHEERTLAAEVVEILKTDFGVETGVQVNHARHTCRVYLFGVQWAQLFESLCSRGSAGKHLHPDLAAGPIDFLAEVLRGWTDGDGHGPDDLGGATVSPRMAATMFDIANAVGLRPRMETSRAYTGKDGVTRKKVYKVFWSDRPDRGPDGRSEQDDKYLWRKVDGVVREDFTGDVFNFEVAGDHSYVADGVGVHNCCGFASVQIVEAERRQEGMEEVGLSEGDLYAHINGGRDQGALLEDALERLMTVGVARRSSVPPLTVYKNQINEAHAGPERKFYRVTEAWWCPTAVHAVSAVLRGFRVLGGVFWTDGDRPDPEGYLPLQGRGSRGGHAIPFFGTRKRGGEWYLPFINSWSVQWGQRGWGYWPVRRLAEGGSNFGMWALRAAVSPSIEDNQPPPPVTG